LEEIIKDKLEKVDCQEKKQKENKKKEEHKLKQSILIGKIIIYTMAVLNVPFSFLLVVIGYPVFYFFVQIGLSIALILGFNWVRILFGIGAIGAGLSYLHFTISNARFDRWAGDEAIMTIYLIITIVGLVGGSLLLFSKSVKEFIDNKR